jgi:hypothetical protein
MSDLGRNMALNTAIVPGAFFLVITVTLSDGRWIGVLAGVLGLAIWWLTEIVLPSVQIKIEQQRKFTNVARSLMWVSIGLVGIVGLFFASQKVIATVLPQETSEWVYEEARVVQAARITKARVLADMFGVHRETETVLGLKDGNDFVVFNMDDFTARASDTIVRSIAGLMTDVLIYATMLSCAVLLIAWMAKSIFWPLFEKSRLSNDGRVGEK